MTQPATQTPPAPPAPATPSAPAAPDTPPAPDADKAFTQADVDRIVADRVRRAKPADYDDLKAAAKRLEAIEAANATDLEKAVSAAKKETEDTIRAEVRRERVLDRVEVLAAKDFADPEDARLRLERDADQYVTKDGQPDSEAIKTALAQLLKDKPHLSAVKDDGRPKGDADLGPRTTPPPSNPRAADLQQIEADLAAARRHR